MLRSEADPCGHCGSVQCVDAECLRRPCDVANCGAPIAGHGLMCERHEGEVARCVCGLPIPLDEDRCRPCAEAEALEVRVRAVIDDEWIGAEEVPF